MYTISLKRSLVAAAVALGVAVIAAGPANARPVADGPPIFTAPQVSTTAVPGYTVNPSDRLKATGQRPRPTQKRPPGPPEPSTNFGSKPIPVPPVPSPVPPANRIPTQ